MSPFKTRNFLKSKDKTERESTPHPEEESNQRDGWMTRKTEILKAIATLCGLYWLYKILSLQKATSPGKSLFRFCVKGAPRTRTLGPFLFNFMQFWGENGQINKMTNGNIIYVRDNTRC